MNRRQLSWLAVGGAAAALGIGAGLWRRQRSTVRGDHASGNGPWGMTFERAGGGTIDLADYAGKPLVLNFWATWCAPCVHEMPQLERFHQAFGAKGWGVVGLAIDNAEAVKTFLAKIPVSFPIGLAGMAGAELSRTLGNANGNLPFSAVFDKDARLLQRRLGETSYDELARWAMPPG